MANKRVSELAPITAQELDNADLMLISDISAHESKKVALQDLGGFLLSNGNLSGSLYGTASYATNANSASYAPMVSASYANTSSWANNVVTASYAIVASSSSLSVNSTYALTASYALTSSVQTVYTSAFADYANTASYLRYVPGTSNGTASFAVTASCLLQGLVTQVSASYSSTSSVGIIANYALDSAHSAISDDSETSDSASFLIYSPNNGTASYAMSAGGFGPLLRNYGIYTPDVTQSNYAKISYVSIAPSDNVSSTTEYECIGSAVLALSGSNVTGGNISLNALNRFNGTTTILDSVPISFNWYPTSATTQISGTVQLPFTLLGQTSPVSDFVLYLTSSSPNVSFDSTRKAKFKIHSYSDQVIVSPVAEAMLFTVYPSSSLFQITSSGGNSIGNMYTVDGMDPTTISSLNMSTGSISDIRYTWTMTNLYKFNCSNNPTLTALEYGFSNSLGVLDCSNCSLSSIISLQNTSLLHFSCSNNNLFQLPSLPSTVIALYADWNRISNVGTLPDSIVTMSIANGMASPNFLSFPANLAWVSFTNTPITSLPTIPLTCVSLNFNGCSLPSPVIDAICLNLVNNGQSNGTLDIRNNGVPSSTAFGYIVSLSHVGWTVLHD